MLLAMLALVAVALAALLGAALGARKRVLATILVVDSTHDALRPTIVRSHETAVRSASLRPERSR